MKNFVIAVLFCFSLVSGMQGAVFGTDVQDEKQTEMTQASQDVMVDQGVLTLSYETLHLQWSSSIFYGQYNDPLNFNETQTRAPLSYLRRKSPDIINREYILNRCRMFSDNKNLKRMPSDITLTGLLKEAPDIS